MVRYVWLNRASDHARCHRHGGPRSPGVDRSGDGGDRRHDEFRAPVRVDAGDS